jgi:hypothetical protein
MIQAAAVQFAKEFEVQDFQASSGWMNSSEEKFNKTSK